MAVARPITIGTGDRAADIKALTDWSKQARRRTVRVFPPADTGPSRGLAIYIAQHADECPEWWTPSRDIYLRRFWPSESYLAGAVFSIAARNAAYKFELTGPERAVARAQRMLAAAQLGKGWHQLILKLTIDLLTQDNGAFCEIIRPARVKVKGLPGRYSRYDGYALPAIKQGVIDLGSGYGEVFAELAKAAGMSLEVPVWGARLPTGETIDLLGYDYMLKDSPYDLPLGLAHLDAAKCQRTGNPEYPVIYKDIDGKEHRLRWWQVFTMEELPSPEEEMYGVQYSFVTRVFRLAQTLRDMQILMQEKASGRFAGRVYLTNVDADAIMDAIAQAKEAADAAGLRRYMPPILADTVDPHAEPKVVTVDMANLPEGFNFDLFLQWYISGMAMAGGVDYGFLAPLPGKGLGTASQSEVQERQARGKSSRLFQGQVEHQMNFGGILPRSVTYKYKETDHAERQAIDEGKQTRAETRKTMIETGEITPKVARQMAVDQGDYPPSYLALMDEEDVTPVETADDAQSVEAERAQTEITGEFTAEQAPGPGAVGQQQKPGQGEPPVTQEQGQKGGPGSGNWAHTSRTRIGQVGGSDPGGGLGAIEATTETDPTTRKALAGNKRLARLYAYPGAELLHEIPEKVRAEQKDQVCRDIVRRLGYDPDEDKAVYADVARTARQWAYTATDEDMRSLAMQEAAAKEFGVPISDFVETQMDLLEDDREGRAENLIRYTSGWFSEITTREEAMAHLKGSSQSWFPLQHQTEGVTDQAVLRAMYESTQERLRLAGFAPGDVVRLYRGTGTDDATALEAVHGRVQLDGNPLESWAVDLDSAISFGLMAEVDGLNGLVVACDVPVEDIVSIPMTGMGCWAEGEAIVLGSTRRPASSVRPAEEYMQ